MGTGTSLLVSDRLSGLEIIAAEAASSFLSRSGILVRQ
jgi:hypothetical protein